LKGFQVLGRWICQPDWLFFPTAINHEAPLSGYFILLLQEELEHIWEFVQFEEEHA
jgi:hypothetical protein